MLLSFPCPLPHAAFWAPLPRSALPCLPCSGPGLRAGGLAYHLTLHNDIHCYEREGVAPDEQYSTIPEPEEKVRGAHGCVPACLVQWSVSWAKGRSRF